MGRDTEQPRYRMTHLRPKAERYIRSLTPRMQERVAAAMAKIRLNPFRNRRPLHIRQLRGRLAGLHEYRGIHNLRIIYEVFEDERAIEVLKKDYATLW